MDDESASTGEVTSTTLSTARVQGGGFVMPVVAERPEQRLAEKVKESSERDDRIERAKQLKAEAEERSKAVPASFANRRWNRPKRG